MRRQVATQPHCRSTYTPHPCPRPPTVPNPWAALACRYDKAKILQKEVSNVQLVACMNPTAGSFYITPRMQRHFATFAVQMPGPEIVRCGGEVVELVVWLTGELGSWGDDGC